MGETKIHLGIASTAIPRVMTVRGRRIVRPSTHYCRMAAAAHANGLILSVFMPGDVNWSQEVVNAWVPVQPDMPNGDWKRVSMRLPNVIYENVFVHLAVKGYASHLRSEARKKKIPVFNPGLPNKWLMNDLLAKSSLNRYVPPTERLSDVSRARKLIKKWKVAYVKPIGGYGGMGVTRIEDCNGSFRVSVDRTQAGIKEAQRVSMNEENLHRILKKKRRVPHIIQREIRLIQLQNRKVDFRVVVARDDHGSWKVMGVVPKMTAGRDGVVTNLIAGGEKMTLEQCQTLAKTEGKVLSIPKIEKCALDIAEFISHRNPVTAMLGFDVGFDEQGDVFLIEMNPKPARSLLTDESRKKLAHHLVLFSKFLGKKR